LYLRTILTQKARYLGTLIAPQNYRAALAGQRFLQVVDVAFAIPDEDVDPRESLARVVDYALRGVHACHGQSFL
jgi:hypothetical protein